MKNFPNTHFTYHNIKIKSYLVSDSTNLQSPILLVSDSTNLQSPSWSQILLVSETRTILPHVPNVDFEAIVVTGMAKM